MELASWSNANPTVSKAIADAKLDPPKIAIVTSTVDELRQGNERPFHHLQRHPNRMRKIKATPKTEWTQLELGELDLRPIHLPAFTTTTADLRFQESSFFPFAMKFLNFVCCLVVLVAVGADAETEFICEFSSRTLACPHGKSLDIKFANFGRIGHNVCFRGYRSGADRVNNCYDESHTDLVGMLCNGQSTCLLPASNEVFGDTCPGVLKYLQVKYHCV